MTKQEKLREGVAHKLAEIEGFDWEEFVVRYSFEEEWRGKADELLKYEDSQDVVIKVEDWLPIRNGMTCTVEPLIID